MAQQAPPRRGMTAILLLVMQILFSGLGADLLTGRGGSLGGPAIGAIVIAVAGVGLLFAVTLSPVAAVGDGKPVARDFPCSDNDRRLWLATLEQLASEDGRLLRPEELSTARFLSRARAVHVTLSLVLTAASMLVLARVVLGLPKAWGNALYMLVSPVAGVSVGRVLGGAGAVLIFVLPLFAVAELTRARQPETHYRGRRHRVPSARNSLRADYRFGLTVGGVTAVIVLAVVVFLRSLSDEPLPYGGPPLWLPVAVVLTLAAGFIPGFLVTARAWTRYRLTTAIGSGLGLIPYRLIDFLDAECARDPRTLRQVRDGYQFHGLPGDRFQSEAEADSPRPQPVPDARPSLMVFGVPAVLLVLALLVATVLPGGPTPYYSGPPRPPCFSGSVCNAAGVPAYLVANPARPVPGARLPAGTGLDITCYVTVTSADGVRGTWVRVSWTSWFDWTKKGYVPASRVYVSSQRGATVQDNYGRCKLCAWSLRCLLSCGRRKSRRRGCGYPA